MGNKTIAEELVGFYNEIKDLGFPQHVVESLTLAYFHFLLNKA